MSDWSNHFTVIDQQKAAISELSEHMLSQLRGSEIVDLALESVLSGDRETLRSFLSELYLQNNTELLDEYESIANSAQATALRFVRRLNGTD